MAFLICSSMLTILAICLLTPQEKFRIIADVTSEAGAAGNSPASGQPYLGGLPMSVLSAQPRLANREPFTRLAVQYRDGMREIVSVPFRAALGQLIRLDDDDVVRVIGRGFYGHLAGQVLHLKDVRTAPDAELLLSHGDLDAFLDRHTKITTVIVYDRRTPYGCNLAEFKAKHSRTLWGERPKDAVMSETCETCGGVDGLWHDCRGKE
jgi:hypothetical protein